MIFDLVQRFDYSANRTGKTGSLSTNFLRTATQKLECGIVGHKNSIVKSFKNLKKFISDAWGVPEDIQEHVCIERKYSFFPSLFVLLIRYVYKAWK